MNESWQMANLSEDIHQLVADPSQSDSDATSDDLILSVPSPLKLLSAPFSKPPHERIRDALVERLKEDKERLLQEIEALKREKEIAIEQKNQAKEELLSSWAEMEEAWEYKEGKTFAPTHRFLFLYVFFLKKNLCRGNQSRDESNGKNGTKEQRSGVEGQRAKERFEKV